MGIRLGSYLDWPNVNEKCVKYYIVAMADLEVFFKKERLVKVNKNF